MSEPKPASGLGAIARTGDELKTLEALRNKLADEIETCESKRDLAALSRQQTEILQQIRQMKKEIPKKGTALDDLFKKRSKRMSGA